MPQTVPPVLDLLDELPAEALFGASLLEKCLLVGLDLFERKLNFDFPFDDLLDFLAIFHERFELPDVMDNRAIFLRMYLAVAHDFREMECFDLVIEIDECFLVEELLSLNLVLECDVLFGEG